MQSLLHDACLNGLTRIPPPIPSVLTRVPSTALRGVSKPIATAGVGWAPEQGWECPVLAHALSLATAGCFQQQPALRAGHAKQPNQVLPPNQRPALRTDEGSNHHRGVEGLLSHEPVARGHRQERESTQAKSQVPPRLGPRMGGGGEGR